MPSELSTFTYQSLTNSLCTQPQEGVKTTSRYGYRYITKEKTLRVLPDETYLTIADGYRAFKRSNTVFKKVFKEIKKQENPDSEELLKIYQLFRNTFLAYQKEMKAKNFIVRLALGFLAMSTEFSYNRRLSSLRKVIYKHADKSTPLQRMCITTQLGLEKEVKKQMKKGERFSQEELHNLLAFSIDFNHPKITKLLRRKIDNINSYIFPSAPLIAAKAGRIECMKELIKPIKLRLNQVNIKINRADENNNSALHHAACGCHTEIIKELLDHKNIEINKENRKGETPFHIAASLGFDTVLLLMHEKQRSINKSNEKERERPHAIKSRFPLLDIVNTKDKKYNYSALHWASLSGHASTIETLHEIGAETSFDNAHQTPLHVAINCALDSTSEIEKETYIETIQTLLHFYPVMLDMQDNRGNTVLHLAALEKDNDLIEMLATYKPDSTRPNKNKHTPIEIINTNNPSLAEKIQKAEQNEEENS